MPHAVLHLEMEPRAADFLELLRDLGHLDERTVDLLTDGLLNARQAESKTTRPVTFDELRRAAALLLFQGDHLRPEQRELLDQEWARLFS